MPASTISPAMRNAIGTELTRQVSYPVSESDIRRWAIAVYWPEPPPERFVDETAAAPSRGIVAPEEFNPFAWAVAELSTHDPEPHPEADDPDRFERMAGIPGPGLRFMLNGGIEAEYGVPIRPGDVITSVRCLGSYSERAGKLGVMLFSRIEDTWTNQHGELVKQVVNTIIRY